MYTKTKIFNLALGNLGASAIIQNTDEESPQSILLDNYYETARDTVLESHEWSFACGYKELSTSFESSPDGNFLYSFAYPNDCIAPRAIIDKADNKEKKFTTVIDSTGAKVILTNSNPCILRYTKRVTNEAYFTPAFVNALAFYLAYQSAQVITGSGNKKNTNFQDYQLAIRQAIVTDARKIERQDQDDTDYTDCR